MQFADEYKMLPQSGLVLACVSGGADSMCLLEALLEISRARGFQVGAMHYNHGLREQESTRDEEFVRDYCKKCCVPFYLGSGDVAGYAKEQGTGIEEAARDMRYGFFCVTAQKTGAMVIATAHTADDNAETVIMNLTRGAGAKGLSGIPPIRNVEYQGDYTQESSQSEEFSGHYCSDGRPRPSAFTDFSASEIHYIKIIRPLMRVSRSEIILYLNGRNIPYVEDSTNDLDIYTRNRIRHAVMPVLKGINPRLNEAVAASSELSRADEEYLSALSDKYIEENCQTIPEGRKRSTTDTETQKTQTRNMDIRGTEARNMHAWKMDAQKLHELPFAVASRVIRKLYIGNLSNGERNLSNGHVKTVLELCGKGAPSSCLSLPGMSVYREYGNLVFAPQALKFGGTFEPVYLMEGDSVTIPDIGLKITCKSIICNDTINKSFTSFLFKRAEVYGKIAVRPRREGDKIRFADRGYSKTLKKLFIERRINARDRALVPVIADDEGVLAVYGIAVGDRAVPESGGPAIEIEFEEIAK